MIIQGHKDLDDATPTKRLQLLGSAIRGSFRMIKKSRKSTIDMGSAASQISLTDTLVSPNEPRFNFPNRMGSMNSQSSSTDWESNRGTVFPSLKVALKSLDGSNSGLKHATDSVVGALMDIASIDNDYLQEGFRQLTVILTRLKLIFDDVDKSIGLQDMKSEYVSQTANILTDLASELQIAQRRGDFEVERLFVGENDSLISVYFKKLEDLIGRLNMSILSKVTVKPVELNSKWEEPFEPLNKSPPGSFRFEGNFAVGNSGSAFSSIVFPSGMDIYIKDNHASGNKESVFSNITFR